MDKVEKDVATLATSFDALKAEIEKMTYIKSITMDANGILTITPSTGSAITYNARTYVTYDMKLEGNKLMVKGPGETTYTEKGTVDVSGATAPILSIDPATGELKLNGVSSNPKVIVVQPGDLATDMIVFNKAEDGVTTISVTMSVNGESVTIPISSTGGLIDTPVTGMLFIPSIIDNGTQAIDQGYINELDFVLADNNNDAADRFDRKVMFNWQNVQFRVNPTNANVAGLSFSFVNTLVTDRTRATNDNTNLYKAPTANAAYGEGAYSFKLSVKNWSEPVAGKTHLFALNLNVADGEEVMSDYVKVVPQEYLASIQNKIKAPVVNVLDNSDDYPMNLDLLKPLAVDAHHKLLYGAQTKTNLYNLVLDIAWVKGNESTRKQFASHNFEGYSFKFEKVSYTVVDDTDQASFITIEQNGDITIERQTAAIERRPIVKATIVNDATGAVVALGFIKFHITNNLGDYTHTVEGGPYNYNELFTGAALSTTLGDEYGSNKTPLAIGWDDMNTIYENLGVSHDEFRTNYPTVPTSFTVVNGDAVSRIEVAQGDENTSSYAIQYNVTPYSKFGVNTVTYKFTPTAIGKPVLTVVFKYTVNRPVLNKVILKGFRYNNDPKIVNVKGMEVGGLYEMQAYLGEAFNYGRAANTQDDPNYLGYRVSFTALPSNTEEDMICGSKHQFIFKNAYNAPVVAQLSNIIDGNLETVSSETTAGNGTAADYSIDKILGTNTLTGVKINLVNLLTEPFRMYDMVFKTIYVNGEVDNGDYKIRFENPITIELATPNNFVMEQKPAGDILDVTNNYVVKFKGKILVNKGVASTVDNATNIDASRYVDITQPTLGLFYDLLNANSTYKRVSHILPNPNTAGIAIEKSPLFNYVHEGSELNMQVVGGEVKCTFKTSFSEASRTDNLYLKPSGL